MTSNELGTAAHAAILDGKLGRYDYHCPDADYRASPGLSYSESKLLQRSPAHYRWVKDNPRERRVAPKPEFRLGLMVHCAVLEPARFERDYVLEPRPGISKNSNEWKAFAAACALAGQQPITEDEREQVFGMRDALRTHPRIAQVLANGHPEVSCWWTDEATGCECRARLDWLAEFKGGILVPDLKSTQDARPEAFSRSVLNFEYHRQCCWYMDAAEACFSKPVLPMLFLVVESTPPFACKTYTLHRTFIDMARKENRRLRELHTYCTEMGEWPSYDDDITELAPPRWALDPDARRELDAEEAIDV